MRKWWLSLLSRPKRRIHQIENGRLYAMQTVDLSMLQLFGVVEAPADGPHECLVMACIDSSLSLELHKPKNPKNHGGCCDTNNLWKYEMPGIMAFLYFIHYQHLTQFDVYVRRSHIVHEDPSKRWFLIAGMAQGGLAAGVMDGLYDIKPSGMTFCKNQPETDPFKPPSSFFGEKLWGKDGAMDLVTTRGMMPSPKIRQQPCQGQLSPQELLKKPAN